MENPATHGEAERIVRQAIHEHDNHQQAVRLGLEEPVFGLSLTRKITDALRAAGLLRENQAAGTYSRDQITQAADRLLTNPEHYVSADGSYADGYLDGILSLLDGLGLLPAPDSYRQLLESLRNIARPEPGKGNRETDAIICWKDVQPGDLVLIEDELVKAIDVKVIMLPWSSDEDLYPRTYVSYQEDGRLYTAEQHGDRLTAVRREEKS